jgi:hypothetical protein
MGGKVLNNAEHLTRIISRVHDPYPREGTDTEREETCMAKLLEAFLGFGRCL